MDDRQRAILAEGARGLPYPVAAACQRLLDHDDPDAWLLLETVSRDVLQPVLTYLSHLLLSDLVATGSSPAELFHLVERVLTRPLTGEYVGFLRETARYYRENGLESAIPELVDFLVDSEIECRIAPGGKPLLGLLVEYRTQWAHGRIDDPAVAERTAREALDLATRMIERLSFLRSYPLHAGGSEPLVGSDPPRLSPEADPHLVVVAGPLDLRPLLLKLEGRDIVALVEFDASHRRMAYRGVETFVRYRGKKLAREPAARVFRELQDLLARVRSVERELERPAWEDFARRVALVTRRTLDSAAQRMFGQGGLEMRAEEILVPRPRWEGPEGRFAEFLRSDHPVLVISGPQGTGKSALVAALARQALAEGHATLLLSGQHFATAGKRYSGNPYPEVLAGLLRYRCPMDAKALRRVVRGAPEGKEVVVFVDGINEVDGVRKKWNRFRALELLLAWIREVAQPNVRFVLAFRLDAYTDYGFLEERDVPPGFVELCMPGDEPSFPWVHRLEPFGEEMARLYYAKLQEWPALGMAPAMSWDELREALGERLEEYVSNPLLFSIFLKIHHGRSGLRTTDPDELFLEYAQRITGRTELARRGWLRRVVGFLWNGNTTRRERFLADVLSKVTENGGSAFTVDQLDPKRSRRDRRLLAVLDDPFGETYRALFESGLLIEERSEVRVGDEVHEERRISFVAEIMATAMNEVWRRYDLREMLSSLAVGSLATSAIWIAVQVTVAWALRRVGYGLPREVAAIVWAPAVQAAGGVLIVGMAGLAVGALADFSLRAPVRRTGLFAAATRRELGRNTVRGLRLIGGAVLAAVGFTAFLQVWLKSSIWGIFAGGGLAILYLVGPRGRKTWIRAGLEGIPARIVRRAAEAHLEWLESAEFRARMCRATSFAVIPAAAGAVALASWYLQFGHGVEAPPVCGMMRAAYYAARISRYNAAVPLGFSIVARGTLLLVLLSAGAGFFVGWFGKLYWQDARDESESLRPPGSVGWMTVGLVGVILVSFLVTHVVWPREARRPSSEANGTARVCDPDEPRATLKRDRRVTDVKILGKCEELANLGDAFPRLQRVEMDVEVARKIGPDFPELPNYVWITVGSRGWTPLDWLTERHGRYVLVFAAPFRPMPGKMRFLERVQILDSGDIDVDILRGAKSLRWIWLNRNPTDPSFYESLLDVVRELPRLEVLTLLGQDRIVELEGRDILPGLERLARGQRVREKVDPGIHVVYRDEEGNPKTVLVGPGTGPDLATLSKEDSLGQLVLVGTDAISLHGIEGLGISSLDIDGAERLENIRALRHLPRLRQLGIEGAPRVADLESAVPRDCTWTSVSLVETGIQDFSSLARCTGLKSLMIWSSKAVDLGFVRELEHLEYLRVEVTRDDEVLDVGPLAGHPRLSRLLLWATVQDVTALASLPLVELEVKHLDGDVAGLGRIEGLGRLKIGRLDGDVAALGKIKGLRTLEVGKVGGASAAEPVDLGRFRAMASVRRLRLPVAVRSLENVLKLPRELTLGSVEDRDLRPAASYRLRWVKILHGRRDEYVGTRELEEKGIRVTFWGDEDE